MEVGASLTTIAYLATDGSPSSGCCRITMTFVGAGVIAEYARKVSTTDTFETWGVPSGATITSVEATGAKGNQQGTATIAAQLYVRVVDEFAASIHGSTLGTDDLINQDISAFSSSWADIPLNGPKSVDVGKSASTQPVRLEIEADVGSLSGICDFRLDTIALTITYTGGSSGGGGGGGGGGDTGGGSGDGGDTGDGTSVTSGGGVYPDPDCELPTDINVYGPLTYGQNLATAGFWQNRLYLSYGGITYLLDAETGGWIDTNYGFVRQFMPVSVPNQDDWLFLIAAQVTGTQGYLSADNFIAFTSPMVLPGQAGALNLGGDKQIVLGPFDGAGPDRESVKRAVKLRVWGEYDLPAEPPDSIGTVTMFSDTGYTETYPILSLARAGYTTGSGANPPRVYAPGMLFEQGFRTAMRGRVLWAVCTFTEPCVTIRDSMLEYVRLQGNR